MIVVVEGDNLEGDRFAPWFQCATGQKENISSGSVSMCFVDDLQRHEFLQEGVALEAFLHDHLSIPSCSAEGSGADISPHELF